MLTFALPATKLGFPTTDPHGSPIPKKFNKRVMSLISQKLNVRVRILKDQENESVESDLWELGLLPNTFVTIERITKEKIILKQGQKRIEMEPELAGQVVISKK